MRGGPLKQILMAQPVMMCCRWKGSSKSIFKAIKIDRARYGSRPLGPAERNHRLQQSSEIIRMFNSAFDGLTGNDLDFWPVTLREEIEEINADIYQNVNNGVYRSGFATHADAYEQAVSQLFASLDSLELRLNGKRYLLGNTLTEADWRLFTTLVRFDAVYFGHFKCNIRRIADYPALSGFMRELFQMPGISNTVNMKHIKYHYYASHLNINPTGIVPIGPEQDFGAPHGRDHL